MATVTGWWAEIHKAFALSLTPSMGFAPSATEISALLGLSIIPGIGISGAGHSVASFSLELTQQLGIGVEVARRAGSFDLAVTPQIAGSASEHYARDFAAALTAGFDMIGAEHHFEIDEFGFFSLLGVTIDSDGMYDPAQLVGALFMIDLPELPEIRPFHVVEEMLHDATWDAAWHYQDLGIPAFSFRAVLTSGEASFLASHPSEFLYYAIPYNLVRAVVEDDPMHTATRDDDWATTMAGFVSSYGIDDMYLMFGSEWDNDPGNLYWAQNRFLEAGSAVNPNHPTTGMTRQQIYDQFMHFYLDDNHDGNTNHHQLGQILNVPYPVRGYKTYSMNVYAGNVHFAYEMGVDQVVLERNNDDISGMVGGLALIRGAGTQYDKKWGIDISHWRSYGLTGVTEYNSSGVLISGWSNSTYRRHFYLSFFGGADTLMLEGVNMNINGTVNINGRMYSPLGEEIRNFTDFAYTRHPDRGIAHVPVAVMKDHIVSWEPRWGQWMQARNLWYGVIPCNDGENMMHNLWDLIYPNYATWGTSTTAAEPWGSGRWGEQFDVITEKIGDSELAAYNAVILSTNAVVDYTLQAKLAVFVANGGVVVVNAKQLSGTAHETLTGVHLTGTATNSSGTTVWDGPPSISETINGEPTYDYATCTLGTATTIAHSGTNTPQVVSNSVGDGQVWTVMPEWMSNQANDVLLGIGSKIIDVLTSQWFVMWFSNVNHTDIDYTINTQAGPNGTAKVVMIMNNHASTTWTATLNFEGVFTSVREWISDTDASYTNNDGNTQIAASVPAGDVKVYAVDTA